MDLFQDAKQQLSHQGGRLTRQRRLILKALEAFDGHPTAEELYESIRAQAHSINLSTVYRNLRWLEDEGLIQSHRFEEDHGQQRFDPVQPHEHFHFICTECKQVVEFSTPFSDTIKRQFASQSGAQVNSAAIILYGLCADCQSRS
jgi:Fe2+ or Zn2+ uptake regulation protein